MAFSDDFNYAPGVLTGKGTWLAFGVSLSNIVAAASQVTGSIVDQTINNNDAIVAGIDYTRPFCVTYDLFLTAVQSGVGEDRTFWFGDASGPIAGISILTGPEVQPGGLLASYFDAAGNTTNAAEVQVGRNNSCQLIWQSDGTTVVLYVNGIEVLTAPAGPMATIVGQTFCVSQNDSAAINAWITRVSGWYNG